MCAHSRVAPRIAAPDPGICYGGGGRFTRGAAMYAKLFERRRGVQSAYNGGGGGQSAYDRDGDGGGGGAVRLQRGGGGGGQSAYDQGGGGGVQSASYINQFVNHMHAFSTKTQGTSRQMGPLRTCPVVLHRFVDICPYN